MAKRCLFFRLQLIYPTLLKAQGLREVARHGYAMKRSYREGDPGVEDASSPAIEPRKGNFWASRTLRV